MIEVFTDPAKLHDGTLDVDFPVFQADEHGNLVVRNQETFVAYIACNAQQFVALIREEYWHGV